MSLERITAKEKITKEQLTRDRVFYSLVRIMINDYFKIQEKYEGYIPYEVGKEFTTDLHGALIILEPSDKEIRRYCRKTNYFRPIDLNDQHLISELEKNLEGDGARIIKDNKIILKAGIYAYHQAEKKEGGEINEILEKYLISSMKFIGERETAALAFAIAAKKHSYIISQTIRPTQKDKTVDDKRYSKVGTGKVAEFGPKGLIRTAKLENGEEGVPKEHMLKEDAYIKQYNYKFEKGIYLHSKNYLTLEDVASMSERILAVEGEKDGQYSLLDKLNFFKKFIKNAF
ncbi:MAG: hypothetical protein Q8N77_00035 [Nanoarchaeota archaeon]|nr:hypothetical protein [Nanoarchaeota archaeon]